MYYSTLKSVTLAAGVLVLATAAAPAQTEGSAVGSEAQFLEGLDGHFTGSGTLRRGGGSGHSLSCSFDGNRQGARITLDGRCSTALIFGTSIKIEIRYDPAARRYVGSFRESMGTIAALSGARRGRTLSFSFVETAESVRPNPPARLTITQNGGGLSLSLRSTKPEQGQDLDLVLREG